MFIHLPGSLSFENFPVKVVYVNTGVSVVVATQSKSRAWLWGGLGDAEYGRSLYWS